MKSDWSVSKQTLYPANDNPFGNRFYGYRTTELDLPDNNKAKYHGLLVGSCVHVVAVDNDLTTYMVYQSRPNARATDSDQVPVTLELPGGFHRPGITAEQAANKELIEEVGRQAGSLKQIGVLYPSPGVSNEQDTIFLGTELSNLAQPGASEITEADIEIVAEPFGILYDRIRTGEQPVAAQTLAAMALAATYL